jgi:CHAT domain-containing protein
MVAHQAGWQPTVVTIPGLRILARILDRPLRSEADALVIGNPTGDLRYAELEAQRVGEMLGVSPFIGQQATKDAILDQLQRVRLAHFATHAYFSSDSPLDSGIVLADGVLTAREVLERSISAPEFLVLSACQTGLGGSLGGDEIAGLSQAFFYAGTRSLLVSLWAVNDPATAHLMTKFYQQWHRGTDKAKALYGAMEATRKVCTEWEHPYYWGAFNLVGDWR